MSTYRHRKLIPEATMALASFLLPTGSQIIYLGSKEFQIKNIVFRMKI